LNNEDTVVPFANILARYEHRLRGATMYPDGARGGQPLTRVPYADAVKYEGVEMFHDVCEISGRGGTCGV
jgi:ribonucleoside-diphosphate reductase alpha chain